MKRLILTFASEVYTPQLRVWERQLDLTNPSLERRIIRDFTDPIAALDRRPGEILKALDEGYDQVIFSGADMIFFQPIDFGRVKSLLLFPHCVAPPPADSLHPSVHDILRTGAFNSDLQVWSNNPYSTKFLQWYSSELYRECTTDFRRGLFFDQTYLNLAPTIPLFKPYLDTNHNVAFYNLHERIVSRSRAGHWLVNDQPLSSFHFTGFDPADPARISRHQNRFRAEGALLELMEWYANELKKP